VIAGRISVSRAARLHRVDQMTTRWRFVAAVQNVDKEEAKLSVHESAVLMAVALHADEFGVTWVSQARMSRETRVCRRSVVAALKNLEEIGLLTSEIRFIYGTNIKTTNKYTLNIEAICALPGIGVWDALGIVHPMHEG
jgi:RIO-like serine/threonine protein kinase